jgi:hypothetical protein
MVKPTEISRASLFACLVKEGDNWLREQLSPIPRYLFRISTPRSDGLTNQTWVKSKAGRLNPDGPSTAERLNRHLRWRGQADDGDNLVSWTSSLLFALLGKLIREFFNQQHCTLQKLTFAQCSAFSTTATQTGCATGPPLGYATVTLLRNQTLPN